MPFELPTVTTCAFSPVSLPMAGAALVESFCAVVQLLEFEPLTLRTRAQCTVASGRPSHVYTFSEPSTSAAFIAPSVLFANAVESSVSCTS